MPVLTKRQEDGGCNGRTWEDDGRLEESILLLYMPVFCTDRRLWRRRLHLKQWFMSLCSTQSESKRSRPKRQTRADVQMLNSPWNVRWTTCLTSKRGSPRRQSTLLVSAMLGRYCRNRSSLVGDPCFRSGSP